MLARIVATDAAVGAWAHVDPEVALSDARACDARRAQGGDRGALDGIGIGVKDIIDTADLPTELGSPIHAGRQPTRRRRVHHAAAPGRRLRARQDRHHRIRVHASGENAQPLERCAHAGRLVVGVGRRRRDAPVRRGARHADQRVDRATRGVLRRRGIQAHARHASLRGHLRVQPDARHAGRHRRRCRRLRVRGVGARRCRQDRGGGARSAGRAAHRGDRRLSLGPRRRRAGAGAARCGRGAARCRRRGRRDRFSRRLARRAARAPLHHALRGRTRARIARRRPSVRACRPSSTPRSTKAAPSTTRHTRRQCVRARR